MCLGVYLYLPLLWFYLKSSFLITIVNVTVFLLNLYQLKLKGQKKSSKIFSNNSTLISKPRTLPFLLYRYSPFHRNVTQDQATIPVTIFPTKQRIFASFIFVLLSRLSPYLAITTTIFLHLF